MTYACNTEGCSLGDCPNCVAMAAKARLDWLSAGNGSEAVPNGYTVWSCALDRHFHGATLNDAVDAARAAESGGDVARLRTALAGQRPPGECYGDDGCICPRCMARIAAERRWTESGWLTAGNAEPDGAAEGAELATPLRAQRGESTPGPSPISPDEGAQEWMDYRMGRRRTPPEDP